MLLTNHRTSTTGSTGIVFPKLECWNPVTEVATVAADVDKQRVLCRVSLKVLSDKFGVQDGTPMQSVYLHRAELQDAARRLIETGAYEEDGSIVIRTKDL